MKRKLVTQALTRIQKPGQLVKKKNTNFRSKKAILLCSQPTQHKPTKLTIPHEFQQNSQSLTNFNKTPNTHFPKSKLSIWGPFKFLTKMEDEESHLTSEALEPTKRKRNTTFVFSCNPVHWLRKLCDELHWSFVLNVVVVYGINQGLAVGLSAVSIKYYMKDEQKLQPSEAQVYFGIIQLPWIVKPLWGLLTDTVPVRGYRRRPYFVVAGLLGSVSMLTLSLNKNLDLAFALLALMGGSAGIAIADVTIDACVTQNSISHPSLAGDMQSLCGLSSSMGSLIGFLISGFIIHLIGPKGVFGVLSIPPILVILTGFVLRETRVQSSSTYKRVKEKFMDAAKGMYTALKCRDVWRPCLYMYLSLALSLNIHEGMFYWITDAKGGPSFSQEIIGSIFSVGAAGSLIGILIYQNFLRNHPFRDILLWTQLLHGASGLLDLMLVLRLNLRVGVPDYFFIVIDEAVSRMIVRLKWMPLLVLSSKLCPAGIEGTFFALLMSIDHVGMLSSSWAGGIILHSLDVTRTKFNNLWLAILMRSIMRIFPVGLLFLIPRSDPSSAILPAEMLKSKKGDDILDPDNVEMAPLIHGS